MGAFLAQPQQEATTTDAALMSESAVTTQRKYVKTFTPTEACMSGIYSILEFLLLSHCFILVFRGVKDNVVQQENHVICLTVCVVFD